MKYELPKNKEDFIEKYKLKERVFSKENNQYYIRNYSGLNSSSFDLNNNISNYLDNGNISIQYEWEENLEQMIKNFTKRVCYNEGILKKGNFSDKAIVVEKTYVEDEIDGKKIVTDISGGSGPLYSEAGKSVNQFINIYGKLFFNYLGTEEKLLMCKAQKKYD